MNKIKTVLLGIVGLIVMLLLFELMIPTASGITSGILQFLWIPFKELFITDAILTTILYVILALGVAGTIYGIPKWRERKLWSIAGAIVSTLSTLALLIT